jgi:hypothetical protein
MSGNTSHEASMLECRQCGHRALLTGPLLSAIAVKLGVPPAEVPWTLERRPSGAKCSLCGSRDVAFKIKPTMLPVDAPVKASTSRESRQVEGSIKTCPQCHGYGGIGIGCYTCGGAGFLYREQ